MAGARETASAVDADLAGARILVVEARYYEAVADQLLAGARSALERAGSRVEVATVPGALEIPAAIAILLDEALAAGDPYEAAVALGCVIRGETSHYDTVAGESARALMDLSVERRLPLGNAILTVENEAQALARAGAMDKGGGAVQAALILLALKRRSTEAAHGQG